MEIDYKKLDKNQLARLEKLLKTLKDVTHYEENKPPFTLTFIQDKDKISLKDIDNTRRPPTQFRNRQRAHTLAYSALLHSLSRMFTNVSFENLQEILHQFHKELNMVYVTSISGDSMRFKGRRAVIGKMDLHELKNLSDNLISELLAQSREEFFTTTPPLLKFYLTTFLYMHNRLVDATVDQDSTNGGEGCALQGLEKLEVSLEKDRSAVVKNSALKYLSWLIDEKAVNNALIMNPSHSCLSIVAFQILGLYKLLSSFPYLIKGLSMDNLLSKNAAVNETLVHYLSGVIFYRLATEEEAVKFHPTDKEVALIKNSLNWLYEVSRATTPYGTLSTVH